MGKKKKTKSILSILILITFFVVSFIIFNYSCKEIHLYADYSQIECPLISIIMGMLPLTVIFLGYYFSHKTKKAKYIQIFILIVMVCYPLIFLSATKSCSITALFGRQVGDWCWNDKAEQNEELIYCDKIIRGGNKDHCYMKVSIKTNNLEACDKISHLNYKKFCIGVLTKNQSLCNEITDGKYAGWCLSQI